MSEKTVDPQQLKDEQRRDWDAAAAGWKKWWPVFERSAQHISDRLVELAGVKPGARVLDVATGNGEPAARLYYDPRYYAGNVLDPDGYSLEFVYKSWQHPQQA